MKNQGFEHLYPQQSRHFSVVSFFFPPRFTWEDGTLYPSREIWKEDAPGVGGILFQFFLRYHTNFLICPTSRKGEKRSQLNPRSLLSVRISPRLEILESGGSVIHREVFKHPTYL